VRIDLHTHSSVSDGTETPEELIAAAKRAGLDVVALTDHDSTAGWDRAAAAAQQQGIVLVRGAEFSCRQGRIAVHLLSYLQDPDYGPIRAELERVRASRVERARAIVDKLARDYPITWEQVQAQAGDAHTIGRPHIADALVALGVVPDRTAAFEYLLSPRGPYYVRHYSPSATGMIELVREAGGVPVIAHPGAVGRHRIVDDDAIADMVDAGLGGIEVRHRDNPPEQRKRLAELAEHFDLFTTGSSDYHGAGKPNRLGENLTSDAALAAIESQAFGVPVLRPVPTAR
jgi:predicted metal-dependent phosphoesterase TrpH